MYMYEKSHMSDNERCFVNKKSEKKKQEKRV